MSRRPDDPSLTSRMFAPRSEEKILEAFCYAIEKHKNQKRKSASSLPYIVHPLEVALILDSIGKVKCRETLIAAFLHDTVEDTDATLDEIEDKFGSKVRSIVEEVTDDKTLPKEERKRLQVATAPHHSTEAKLIKLADKLANCRDLTDSRKVPVGWSECRVLGYIAWASEVVEGLRGTNSGIEWELEKLFDEFPNLPQTREDRMAICEAFISSMKDIQ